MKFGNSTFNLVLIILLLTVTCLQHLQISDLEANQKTLYKNDVVVWNKTVKDYELVWSNYRDIKLLDMNVFSALLWLEYDVGSVKGDIDTMYWVGEYSFYRQSNNPKSDIAYYLDRGNFSEGCS